MKVIKRAGGQEELHGFEQREDGEVEVTQVRSIPAVKDRLKKVHGKLEIAVENVKTGEVERTIEVHNLFVTNGYTALMHLIAGDDQANYAVSQMAFGTGTTVPAVGDTGLEVAITPVKTVASIDYPDATSVRFTATLESDEANGFPVAEAALYTVAHGMAARVTFGPLTKSADLRFVMRWTLAT